MKQFKTIILSTFTILTLVATAGVLSPTAEAAVCTGTPVQCAKTGAGKADTGGKSLQDSIKDVVNVLLFLIGAISVIVIIISGIKYVTSDGDASKIKSAKDTILYAVVGVIVALLAYGIVNFILDQFA
jgi:hypothetical protein